MQKIKNIHRVDPWKNVLQTDKQADRQTEKWADEQSDFIGPLLQR